MSVCVCVEGVRVKRWGILQGSWDSLPLSLSFSFPLLAVISGLFLSHNNVVSQTALAKGKQKKKNTKN